MVLTTADVVTQESVETMVQAQTERVYGFRQAFREHTAGGDVGPSLKFPLTDEDFEGDMVEVPESSEYPRASKSYGDVEAVYTKYGLEFPITEEALEDGVLNLQLDAMQDAVREEATRMDAIAYGILNANSDEVVIDGTSDSTLTFDRVVDARAEHRSNEYNPDLMLVEPFGASTILKDDAFKLRDTPVGDRAVTQGFIGAVAGLDIFEVNTGQLGMDEAILVDTDHYGYESAKYRNDVSSYEEEEKDQTVWKIRDRLDWAVTDADAALKVVYSA